MPLSTKPKARTAEDDGLPCHSAGAWADYKYRWVSLYDKLFSTGMKYK